MPSYRTTAAPSAAPEVVQVAPHPLLRPGIRFYRGFRITGPPRKRLELPIGIATLVLGFDQRITVAAVDGPATGDRGRTYSSLYTGMRTKGTIGEHAGSVHGIEIVLHPWASFGMFGMPQSELAEQLVDPLDFGGARIRRLTERLAEAPDWTARFALLDDTFLRWQSAGAGAAPRVLHAWDLLAAANGALPIGRLADQVGWSERQLERRFREQIGLSPKAMSRVLRLQHAVKMLLAGRPLADIAGRAGFYDQSHLNREIRTATGLTPGGFLSRALAAPTQATRLEGRVTSLVLEG